jgi:hypothetical protein
LISPDGKLLAGVNAEGEILLRGTDGGQSGSIRGSLRGDELIQWSGDSRFIFVRGRTESTIELSRLDLSTGRRELSNRIAAADPVGLIGIQPASVHMTPDGRSVVYTYWKVLTELYLVDFLT